MKFLSEYRDPKAAEKFAAAIRGGQTHTIVKSGLEDLLPNEITLVQAPAARFA